MKRVAIITMLFLFVAVSAFAGSYEDGVKAYDNNEYKKAFQIFSKLAEKGDAMAQYNLGVMYENGQGGVSLISQQSINKKRRHHHEKG